MIALLRIIYFKIVFQIGKELYKLGDGKMNIRELMSVQIFNNTKQYNKTYQVGHESLKLNLHYWYLSDLS